MHASEMPYDGMQTSEMLDEKQHGIHPPFRLTDQSAIPFLYHTASMVI